MRSVAILGATGSIGAQALEIVRDSPDLRLVALSAHSSSGPLLAAARAHGVELVALTDERAAASLAPVAPTRACGPFRGWAREMLADVTAEPALAHATGAIGEKITDDSSTIRTAGQNLREARHLFRLPYQQIEVVVPPPSDV